MPVNFACGVSRFTLVLLACVMREAAAFSFNVSAYKEMSELVKDKTKYESSARPPPYDAPIDVELNIYIIELSNVNVKEKELTMDFYFWQQWTDPRLAEIEGRVYFTNHIDDLWVPDTYVTNEKSAFMHTVTQINKAVKINSGGKVFYSQRLTVILSCEYDLQPFPFDIQRCSSYIESARYSDRDIGFYWHGLYGVVNKAGILLPEFSITDINYFACRSAINIDDDKMACLGLTFELTRYYSTYYMKLFIPASVIVATSFFQFWIDFRKIQARIIMGLFPILTLQTLYLSVSRKLPNLIKDERSHTLVSTSMDIFMVGCMCFLFMGFCEYLLVQIVYAINNEEAVEENTLEKEQGEEKEAEDKEEAKKKSKFHDIGMTSSSSDSSSEEEEPKTIAVWRAPPIHKGGKVLPKSQWLAVTRVEMIFRYLISNLVGARSAFSIDLTSRIVFPFFYIIFQIVFWQVLGPEHAEPAPAPLERELNETGMGILPD